LLSPSFITWHTYSVTSPSLVVMVMVVVVAVVVVEEEGASTIETVVKAATVKREITVVKPEASTIETVVKPEVAKPEATETTLAEVVEASTTAAKPAEAAIAKLGITDGSAIEITAAPVCRLR
jgi:hypothetical protein